jgi:hypothetical protein
VADRYCRSYGHELRETDRFCPNCASPVREVAHVPTPEADAPVPPPPQPDEDADSPEFRLSPLSKIVAGLLLIFVILIGIVALAEDGGGDPANSPPERAEQDVGVEEALQILDGCQF